jgi:hypothetical protein
MPAGLRMDEVIAQLEDAMTQLAGREVQAPSSGAAKLPTCARNTGADPADLPSSSIVEYEKLSPHAAAPRTERSLPERST